MKLDLEEWMRFQQNHELKWLCESCCEKHLVQSGSLSVLTSNQRVPSITIDQVIEKCIIKVRNIDCTCTSCTDYSAVIPIRFGTITNEVISVSDSDDVEFLFVQKVPTSVNSIKFRKDQDLEAALQTMRKLPQFGFEAVTNSETGMMWAGLPIAEPTFEWPAKKDLREMVKSKVNLQAIGLNYKASHMDRNLFGAIKLVL